MEVSQSAVDFQNASEELLKEASRAGTPRIVFFLTLNGRALRQVIRLIKSLFHERHYFYIHVDAVSENVFHKNAKCLHECKNWNSIFAETRFHVSRVAEPELQITKKCQIHEKPEIYDLGWCKFAQNFAFWNGRVGEERR